MSDINTLVRMIDNAGNHLFYLKYKKKSGEISDGVFHANVKYNLRGGEDSTRKYDYYRSLYNVQKKRWSKINLGEILEAKIDGKTYKFG